MVKRLPKTISEKQFIELLKAEKDKRYKLILILGFYQGMRISEITGLKEEVSACCRVPISSIRKDKRKVRSCSKCGKSLVVADIRRSTKDWKIEPLKPKQIDRERGFIRLFGKGGKSADIPLMKPTEKALRTGIKLLPITLSTRQVQRHVNELSEEIFGKEGKIHFHCLRHSSAVYWLHEKKLELRYVQGLLRHARLDTTGLYLNISPSGMKEAFDSAWEGN